MSNDFFVPEPDTSEFSGSTWQCSDSDVYSWFILFNPFSFHITSIADWKLARVIFSRWTGPYRTIKGWSFGLWCTNVGKIRCWCQTACFIARVGLHLVAIQWIWWGVAHSHWMVKMPGCTFFAEWRSGRTVPSRFNLWALKKKSYIKTK